MWMQKLTIDWISMTSKTKTIMKRVNENKNQRIRTWKTESPWSQSSCWGM